MRHLPSWLLVSVSALALLVCARACSFEDEPTDFVGMEYADGTFADFARGHLGIIEPGWHSRYLVLAYRQLTGKTLTPDEQTKAVAAHNFAFSHDDDWYGPSHSTSGLTAWVAARDSVGPVDGYVPPKDLATMRQPPGEQDSSFANCLDPAFTTAAATLNDRVQRFGVKSPELLEWVRGQDAVFSNCGDGKPVQFFGPGQAPPPPPAPHLPAALASGPAWLQQDRAYQIAAAKFYALDFDGALAGFKSIAADTSSTWSPTARYLEARAYLRKATLAPPSKESNATPGQHEALAAAARELTAMQHEPRMQPMRHAIDSLLDYTNARLDPARQQVVIAERLLAPQPTDLTQNLIDSTALHTPQDADIESIRLQPAKDSTAAARSAAATTAAANAAVDLLNWIDAMNNSDAAVAHQHWRQSHSLPWLIAAMAFAQPGDPDAAALIAEARKLPPSSPGSLTVTYHRLRLAPNAPETRSELLALLPQLRKTEGHSAVNDFSTLLANTSPQLGAWLALAERYPQQPDYLPAEVNNPQGVTSPAAKIENVCGANEPALPYFDPSYVFNLNNNFSLDELALAAEDTQLPADQHYQIAEAAWARAVLLDRPEIARRMAPLLIACRPAWKPLLDTYNASRTPDDLRANGLLALMRFASTEPSVREARNTFATYSDTRDNWWCTAVPDANQSIESDPLSPPTTDGDEPKPALAAQPPTTAPPPFLTRAQIDAAHAEVTRLRTIPRASTYFAHQALAWHAAHPKDTRTPDIVGDAFRAVRNGCRFDPPNGTDATSQAERSKQIAAAKTRGDEPTADLAHKLFDVLHRDYPESEWTKRFKTWM